jgi:hypothetical protein
MATNTPKLGLIKPDFVDVVDISDLNDNMDVLDDALAPTNVTSPVAGEKLVFDGTNWVNLEGYVFVETVYFTSSGTFSKASYPWLRAIRVKVQGAGGGSGGAATTTGSQVAGAGGGGGGAYVESFITDIAGLASSVTVTRGAGGAGGAAGNNAGSTGGASSFGALVSADGGGAGSGQGAVSGAAFFANNGSPGTGGTGDIVVPGEAGGHSAAITIASPGVIGGTGGGSFLGRGARVRRASEGGTAETGFGFGSGASGASNGLSESAKAGAAGANGIVIVELYA